MDNVLIDVGEAMALAFDGRTLLTTPGCESNLLAHNRLWAEQTPVALGAAASGLEPLSAAERDWVMGVSRLALARPR